MRATITAIGVGILATIIGAVEVRATEITAVNSAPPGLSNWFSIAAGIVETPPNLFDSRVLQTFVAEKRGLPASVSFIGYVNTGIPGSTLTTTAPLLIELVTLNGNQIDTTIASGSLAAAEFDEELVGSPHAFTHTATLMGDVELVAGNEYGLLFRSATPNAFYRIYGRVEDVYLKGEALRADNVPTFESVSIGSDFFFQVDVTPVPEPSAWILGAFALSGLRLARQSRFTRR
jgi:hypothetical protein